MTALQDRDTSILDRYAGEIKQGYQKLLARNNKNRKQVEKLIIVTIARYFKVPSDMQELVMEGFEPETVAVEILEKHIAKILDILDRESYGPEQFSNLIINAISAMLQELVKEISEGFYDGTEGLSKVYKVVTKQQLRECFGEDMGNIVNEFFGNSSWDMIMKAYTEYRPATTTSVNANAQQSGTITEPTSDNTLTIEQARAALEEEVLRQLATVVDEDSLDLDEYDKVVFSKSYSRGDINYQEEKDKDKESK